MKAIFRKKTFNQLLLVNIKYINTISFSRFSNIKYNKLQHVITISSSRSTTVQNIKKKLDRRDKLEIWWECCHWWKTRGALSVVSFHGNSRVWKGLLASCVPVVCNTHNWPGLMRRQSANHNITPPHPSPPHVTIMPFEVMLSLSKGCDTHFFFLHTQIKVF